MQFSRQEYWSSHFNSYYPIQQQQKITRHTKEEGKIQSEETKEVLEANSDMTGNYQTGNVSNYDYYIILYYIILNRKSR